MDNSNLLYLIGMVDSKITKYHQIQCLKQVIPYCKDQLLKNDVPYMTQIVANYNDGIVYFSTSVLDPIAPFRTLFSEYKDDAYKLIFLYRLIAALVDIDNHINYDLNPEDASCWGLKSATQLLMNHQDQFLSMPLYTMVLKQVVDEYCSGSLKGIHGKDLSYLKKLKFKCDDCDDPGFGITMVTI